MCVTVSVSVSVSVSVIVSVWGGGDAPDAPAIPEFMSLLTEHFNIKKDYPLDWTLMAMLVMFRAAYDDEVISMMKEQLP